MASSSTKLSASVDGNVETFCYMVIEEFLMKKNMQCTLWEFRKEWKRPTEDVAMISWYEVALKLQIPELVNDAGKDNSLTVLENTVKALARESSIRTRRSQEVTVSGLATVPRTTSLPSITEPAGFQVTNNRPKSSQERKPRVDTSGLQTGSKADNIGGSAKKSKKGRTAEAQALIQKKLEFSATDKFGKNKPSTENWIPEALRMRSLHRDLSVMKETLEETLLREDSQKRELKRLAVSDYDKNVNEETLGMAKKTACACCLQEYLLVNLPLRVSHKAIIDIRVKWSGGLTSATVFGGTNTQQAIESSSSSSGSGSGQQPGTGTSEFKSTRDDTSLRLSVSDIRKKKSKKSQMGFPALYEDVRVCLFCSQFFHVQEKYRPSYAEIVHEEKKASYMETKRREREYWDPLKMVQKDREIEEAAEREALLLALTAAQNEALGDSDLGGANKEGGGDKGGDNNTVTGNSTVGDATAEDAGGTGIAGVKEGLEGDGQSFSSL